MEAHLELDRGGFREGISELNNIFKTCSFIGHLKPEVGLATVKNDGYRTIILKWTTPSTKAGTVTILSTIFHSLYKKNEIHFRTIPFV